MFTFDRDTATVVAILICIVGSLYLYKELKSTKDELNEVKGTNGQITSFLSQIGPIPVNSGAPQMNENNRSNEAQVENDIEENQESEEESSE
ncbi:MAG: hypothetical protein Ct9H90mV1_0210 [Prasinovirus sp.]|nr:MAG: hypothetical protein Ct9H90mV1_0210 [Prasinovirus sp.]|tara:strand:- start:267 stop:542 length:276 start_codon:yes stop_codon:yes gene_type:complete